MAYTFKTATISHWDPHPVFLTSPALPSPVIKIPLAPYCNSIPNYIRVESSCFPALPSCIHTALIPWFTSSPPFPLLRFSFCFIMGVECVLQHIWILWCAVSPHWLSHYPHSDPIVLVSHCPLLSARCCLIRVWTWGYPISSTFYYLYHHSCYLLSLPISLLPLSVLI